MEPKEEWAKIHSEDLWVYNKLFLSHKLGYVCGPVGVPVPIEGQLYHSTTVQYPWNG